MVLDLATDCKWKQQLVNKIEESALLQNEPTREQIKFKC